jgi:hypothetical protein
MTTVAQRNQESGRDVEAFRQAGWTLVATAPPDRQLVALDPALLAGHERELRTQIASTVGSPAEVSNLSSIARRAQEPATRLAAVDALGRVGPEAQTELAALLTALPKDDLARSHVATLLRPATLDDPWAPKLAALLDSPSLTDRERQQLAFTLALTGLRDGMSLPESATTPTSRALIDRMTVLARRGAADTQGGGL